MSFVEELEALRSKANVHARSAALLQLRKDLETVWRHWRKTGLISEQELVEGYAASIEAVREHASDREWTACAAHHFAQLADQIHRDHEHAERIRAEMQFHP